MFLLLLSLVIDTANADSGASGGLPSVRGLTEAEDMSVSHAMGRVKTVRKAATVARSCAIATGDADTIAKADAIITRLDDLQRKLDHVATETDLKAALEGIDRQLISIGAQLTALTAAIDVLPTSDEVRLIVREEIAASRAGCDANMPADYCTRMPEPEEEEEVEETPEPVGEYGYIVGIGGNVELRGAYGDVVQPVSGGGNAFAGLTWERDESGLALIIRGGIATVDSTMVGGSVIAYHNGDNVDCGAGLGLEVQSYDILGEGVAAANSVGGTLSGYFRLGDGPSTIIEPYFRAGYFNASGGVDGMDAGLGLRISVAFGGTLDGE